MTSNPWCARFEPFLNRQVIKQRATIAAVPLENLSGESPERAKALLLHSLERLHYVNDQELDILECFMHRAHAYMGTAYPDLHTFLARLQSERLELETMPPVCLTSLAGAGKSELLKAFARVLPSDEMVSLGAPFTTSFELQALKSIVVRAKDSLLQILSQFLPPDCQPRIEVQPDGTSRTVYPKVPLGLATELAARKSYSSGHAIHVLEELQFLTGSASASTKVVQALMTISYLNTPMIYAANFSLCHRLMKRPQEERDRLLGDLIVLLPELPGSEGLMGVLDEYQVVMKEVLSFNLKDEATEIYNMTVGIKRKIKQLTVEAYANFRSSRDDRMTMAHVRAAYRSRTFSAMREDVKAIQEQAMSRKVVRRRLDLWCPFGSDVNNLQAVAKAAADQATLETGKRIQEESLGATQRAALALARASLARKMNQADEGEKVVALSTRSRVPRALDAKTLLADTLASRKQVVDDSTP